MTREELVRETVRFVLSHYETGRPFQPVAVDPDSWWSKVQLLPHDPAGLLPASRAHFEARLERWQELAVAELLEGKP